MKHEWTRDRPPPCERQGDRDAWDHFRLCIMLLMAAVFFCIMSWAFFAPIIKQMR